MTSITKLQFVLYSIIIDHVIGVMGAEFKKNGGDDKKGYCPCHFQAHTSKTGQGNKTICVGPIPLQAATALEADEDEEKDEEFSPEYVQKACQYYASDVLRVEDEAEALAIQPALPHNSIFFMDDKCAIVTPDENDPSGIGIEAETCDIMLGPNGYYLEIVLCVDQVTVLHKCRCPCGLFFDDDGTCVGSVTGCEPFELSDGMFLLSFSVLPTVALIARLPSATTIPPSKWPNDTLYFIGAIDQDICAYKNSRDGGNVVSADCNSTLQDAYFFSVLCMAPQVRSNGTCPKTAGLSCRASTFATTLEQVWLAYAALITVASIAITVN